MELSGNILRIEIYLNGDVIINGRNFDDMLELFDELRKIVQSNPLPAVHFHTDDDNRCHYMMGKVLFTALLAGIDIRRNNIQLFFRRRYPRLMPILS